jgi:hypothetical protein
MSNVGTKSASGEPPPTPNVNCKKSLRVAIAHKEHILLLQDCLKGQCNICMVTVGGVKIRACCGKVPTAPKLKSVLEKGLAISVDNA